MRSELHTQPVKSLTKSTDVAVHAVPIEKEARRADVLQAVAEALGGVSDHFIQQG
jgi:hypothetical protein